MDNITPTATETTTTATPEPTEKEAFLATLPEQYREKNYLKNVNNLDDLLKNYDHSQQLIGRKRELNLPTEKSSPEDWNKYYEAIGRPSDANSYKLEYPEELANTIDAENLTKFKELAYEQGMSEKQAQALINYESELYKGLLEKHMEEQTNSEKQFNEVASQVFGKEKEKVLENSELLIKKYIPKGLEDHFLQLDEKSKVLMASVLNGVQKEYISEDNLTGSSKDGSSETVEKELNRAKELMLSQAYNSSNHAEHMKVVSEVNNIYKKIYG